DLATIRGTATVDTEKPVDVTDLPWPDPGAWASEVARSALAGGDGRQPLRLEGSHLYLDRYLEEEQQIAEDLVALAGGAPPQVDDDLLGDGVRRLFGDEVAGRQA